MKRQAFIFAGRSGCGKGTQALLLQKLLEEKDKENKPLYISTGEAFRGFIKGDSYSSRLSKKLMDDGKLQPDFLAVRMWADFFLEKMNGKEHLIGDGMPRTVGEAVMLDTAFKYYGFEKPIVLNIEVSEKSVIKRMELRGRKDDQLDNIKQRLSWYKAQVVPVLKYFKKNPDYIYMDIDGEPKIEEIFEDIKKKLSYLWEKK